ncbi:hypothetical protein GCM10007907_10470 [Chitinimonas prasina]|uniref:Type II secretion system protein GspC N-terminal domain-containing protein n=1 Tax=Chitinimonas prasina TaxID=1434937 RepID=A0ABQ5YBC6_9NEIS|nr:hypothetical protein [Chitinimonas prasina]GLR12257.1 hypothetical protein GCM10007907_10470 [Chitinimonas prasina]
MSLNRKQAMGLALVVVVGLSVWSTRMGGDEDDLTPAGPTVSISDPNVASSTPVLPPDATTAPANGESWQSAMQRDTGSLQGVVADPFGSSKPKATPPAEAAVTEPAAVVAPPPPPPPLAPPYRYLGKLEKGGKLDIYLDNQGSPLIARPGDTLPGGWRLNSLTAGQLVFTHLATSEQHTVGLTP